MTYDFGAQRSFIPGFDLGFFGDALAVYHCHHFNLFLDQTIDDAVGTQAGIALRTQAAYESARQLLQGLHRGLNASTAVERLQIASLAFAAMGHGTVHLDAPHGTGAGRGGYLHYGHSWMEKYGKLVRRRTPADAFASGFAAAAVELAYELEPGTVRSQETACVTNRDEECRFEFTSAAPSMLDTVADRAAVEATTKTSLDGHFETEIGEIVAGLTQFLASVSGDDRGLVQAFGVFVTLHLANYYNRISYGALEHTRRRNPNLVPTCESLLRESGQVCAFHTFGGILLSPEWEGMVGKPDGDVAKHVVGCMAISRALGFGRWTIEDLDPNRRLVIRTPCTYEAAHFSNEQPERVSSYFLQGAVSATMELAHRVPWTGQPSLSDDVYRQLFRTGGTWRAEQTRDVAMGDDYCEVVATRIPS